MGVKARMPLGLVIILSLINFFLSGFASFQIRTVVRPEGVGKRTVEAEIEPEFFSLIQKEKSWLEEEIRKKIPQNIPFKISPRGKEFFFKTSLPLGKGVNFQKKDYLFFADYIFKEKVNLKYQHLLKEMPQEAKQILNRLKLNYTLYLPGKMVKANAQKIWSDKAQWQLKLGKIYEIRAKSQIIRWRLIILTGIFIIIIMGALGAQIIKHQT